MDTKSLNTILMLEYPGGIAVKYYHNVKRVNKES